MPSALLRFCASALLRFCASALLRFCASLRPDLFFSGFRGSLLNLEGDESFWFRSAPLAILLCIILLSGCGPQVGKAEHGSPKKAPNAPPTLLQPSMARIDLGTVVRAGRQETTVYLCNVGTKTVEVTEIRTSCDCFDVSLEKKVIPPGERIKANLTIDFAHEPTFTGELGLRAEGATKAEKELAFVLCVNVRVK